MSTIKTRDIDSSLQKKGFKIDKNKDHVYFYYYNNNKRTNIRTKYSHNEKEVNDYLVKKMSEQLKLNKDNFIRLVECPMTFDEYKNSLVSQGLI